MNPDFLDLLRALLAADARFMVVGAYAVGVHGRPRATKDLDVWVEASPENAPKVVNGLREFGAPLMGLTEADLGVPGIGLQIGVEPGRIDILTAISGVLFDEAWPSKIEAEFGEGAYAASGADRRPSVWSYEPALSAGVQPEMALLFPVCIRAPRAPARTARSPPWSSSPPATSPSPRSSTRRRGSAP